MALFGSARDIFTMKYITREFLENVVSQLIGYYKVVLKDTQPNTYGESMEKTYIGPVLINCLIKREDFQFEGSDMGPDYTRTVQFRFFKDHLIDANVVPEVGDVIMYNELYYLVDSTSENQLIVGKDNQYPYQDGLENFGSSYSIIVRAHYTSPDSLGIKQERL